MKGNTVDLDGKTIFRRKGVIFDLGGHFCDFGAQIWPNLANVGSQNHENGLSKSKNALFRLKMVFSS